MGHSQELRTVSSTYAVSALVPMQAVPGFGHWEALKEGRARPGSSPLTGPPGCLLIAPATSAQPPWQWLLWVALTPGPFSWDVVSCVLLLLMSECPPPLCFSTPPWLVSPILLDCPFRPFRAVLVFLLAPWLVKTRCTLTATMSVVVVGAAVAASYT